MSDWQPIEMAPKDGRFVLVFCGDVYKARYDAARGYWVFADGIAYDPTHWMPLPDPPQAGKEQG